MDAFKTDFHNHTKLSYCARGEMTVANIVRRFEEAGMVQAGISDHFYADGRMEERFRSIKAELAALDSKVQIFVGTEVDMCFPGKLAAGKDDLQIFDYVMIGCTHYQLKDRVVPPLYFDYNSIAQSMFDFMLAASVVEFADIIAHPFHARGLKLYREDFEIPKAIEMIPDNNLILIAKNMHENEIAIELNTILLEKDYAEAMLRFYRICKEEKVKFSIGSDAHWLDSMIEGPLIKDYLDCLQIGNDDIWCFSR